MQYATASFGNGSDRSGISGTGRAVHDRARRRHVRTGVVIGVIAVIGRGEGTADHRAGNKSCTYTAPAPSAAIPPSRRHPIRAATARSPRWQGTAFLIANPFAAGVAEATVASDDVPATNTIVATSFVKRLAFWSLRGVSPCDEPYYGPMADQCAIRSEWDASKRQISSVLWNLPGDRPEEVGGAVRTS